MFQKFGGVIRDSEPVTTIMPTPGDTCVTVVTAKRSYRSKKVVVAVGPWAPKVLGMLGLRLPLKVSFVFSLYDSSSFG
jgi:glycine/D-amino acid oxidase-like deaminating enzyme